MSEADKILRQDILEVMRASGTAALASPHLFVSSLLDVDAGRTKEAKVLANNCTDQLLGIYTAAGRDPQALRQASSKAKSYLVNDRYLNEDVSAAIAEAFGDALCRYYGVAPAWREAAPQPAFASEPWPQQAPAPQQPAEWRQQGVVTQPAPVQMPQPRAVPQPAPVQVPQPRVVPQQTFQPAPATVATNSQSPTDGKNNHVAACLFAIAAIVLTSIALLSETALDEYLIPGVVLAGIIAFFGGEAFMSLLRRAMRGKGARRVSGLVGVGISLAVTSYFFWIKWRGYYGIDFAFIDYVLFIWFPLLLLCVSAIILRVIFAILEGIARAFGRSSRA